MNFAPLIILPLLAAYVFSITWNGSYYYASRENGHRLYFRAAFYGLISTIGAALLFFIAVDPTTKYWMFENGFVWAQEDRQKEVIFGIAFLSVIFGIVVPRILNFWHGAVSVILARLNVPEPSLWHVFLLSRKFILTRVMAKDPKEELIQRSFFRGVPIAFELDGGKVYIGFCLKSVDYAHNAEHPALLIYPLVSGYREKEQSRNLIITHSYEEMYEYLDEVGNDLCHPHFNALDHLDDECFLKVLPLAEIQHMSLFDLNVYKHFQEQIKRNVESTSLLSKVSSWVL